MAQQTAVDWLKMKVVSENNLQNLLVNIDNWFEQAKQMEMEQIIKAVDSNFSYDNCKYFPTLGEQYYNETYNK